MKAVSRQQGREPRRGVIACLVGGVEQAALLLFQVPIQCPPCCPRGSRNDGARDRLQLRKTCKFHRRPLGPLRGQQCRGQGLQREKQQCTRGTSDLLPHGQEYYLT